MWLLGDSTLRVNYVFEFMTTDRHVKMVRSHVYTIEFKNNITSCDFFRFSFGFTNLALNRDRVWNNTLFIHSLFYGLQFGTFDRVADTIIGLLNWSFRFILITNG